LSDPARSMNAQDPPIRQLLAPRGTAPPTPLLCSLLTPIEPDFDPSADPNSLHEPLQLKGTDFRANGLTPVHVHRSPSLEAILIDSSRAPLRCTHPWFDPTVNPHKPVTHSDLRLSPNIPTRHKRSILFRFSLSRAPLTDRPGARRSHRQNPTGPHLSKLPKKRPRPIDKAYSAMLSSSIPPSPCWCMIPTTSI